MPFDHDELIEKLNDRFKKSYRVLSLGGGLQSTTLLLLSLLGKLPKIDFALFADTGWERKATYENVEMLREYALEFDVPIFTVKGYTNIRDQALNPDFGNFIHMPVYTLNPKTGKKMQEKRQCTTHFKIKPIRQFLRRNFGHRAIFEMQIGISRDEALRQKPSGVKYITNTFPLLKMGWSRGSCAEWLKHNDFSQPSKSACVACPLHSNAKWLALTDEERDDAIDFDIQIRDNYKTSTKILKPKPTKDGQLEAFSLSDYDKLNYNLEYLIQERDLKAYAHASCEPLGDFYGDPESKAYQLPLFDFELEECTGMCFL